MPTSVKFLSRKAGIPIDDAVRQLREDGWLDKDATVASFLEDLRTNTKTILSRDRIGRDIAEKKESELTEEEKRLKKEMGREPETPPEGEYETIAVDDLKDGSTYTIIEGRTRDGWDEYKIHKTKEGVTLEDGEIIELEPWDKVQVLKEYLPKELKKPPTEQPELIKAKPKMFGEPEKVVEVKAEKPEKLAALDKVERKASSQFEQDKLFEPKQKPLFSFAGIGARTSDKSSLMKAHGLQNQGTDMEAIRKETGWFLDVDNKWKFEIDDSAIRIRDKGKGEWATLGDAIKHPKLFQAYPELKDVELKLTIDEDLEAPSGSLNAATIGTWTAGGFELEETYSNWQIFVRAPDMEKAKGVLLHEAQHAIQRIEGFATGGSPDIGFFFEDLVKKAKLKELKDAGLKEAVRRINNAKDQVEYEAMRKEFKVLRQTIRELEQDPDVLSPFEVYHRLAGEVEARETAMRRDLTPEQRKAKMPYRDGIPREDVIVRFDRDRAQYQAEAAPKTTADKVFKTILPYLQGMTNFPTVRVVQSIENLPKRLKSKVTAFSKQKNKQVEGFYDKEGDQVFLIADNLSEGRIGAVLRHEAEGHRGIRLLLGSDLDGFLDGIAKAKRKDLKRHDPGLNFKDQEAVRVAADEWIARKIEAGNLGKSFWDDLVRIFRKWLRKMVPNLDLTDREIRSVLVDTVKNVREGRIDRIRTPEGKPLFSTTQGLTEKQRVFLERHYPEKLEAFEKEFKRKSGGTISKESKKGLKDSAIMGETPSSPEGFNMPHEGKGRQVFDLLQFKIQDRLNSLRKVQKTIEKQTATEIPDNTDAYQVEELYHGKVGRRVGEFDVDHLDPLVDSIHESGLDLEDVEEFLYARHAPEANKRLQDINPKREDNEALSGMSNEEAEAIMAKHVDNKAMLDIVSQVDAITKKTRQVLVDEGLATPEEIAAWEKAYKYYVPLKREGKALVAGMPKKGTGMNIRGAESKKRMTGSAELKAVNILANIVAQHEAAIIRAEKAKVGRAMLKLAETNPSKELWQVDAPELKPFLKQRKSDEIDETTGLPATLSEVVFGKDILYKFNDNVLVVKVGGEERTITFNDKNVHAQRIVRSLKNLGADNSNAVINTLAAVNRLLAIVNTSANPEFILSNFTRDIQTAGYNINDTEAKNIKARIFKDVFKALQGIRKGVREDYSSEWAKNYRDFAKAGAQTGWTDHYKNIEDREKSLRKKLDLLKDGKWSSVQRAAKGLFEFVSNENTAVENAIRLSTYIHLKRIGVSQAKAASAAKNLTVNFNRRGDMGQALNALYLFFNANVQGSARLIYAAVRSPTVRRMMYGTVAFAVMLDILNRAIGGDDDDGEKKYDKVPSWVKEHNLILMRPNGNYLKLPLPWGYNTLHVLGQCIGEAIDPNKDKFDVILAAAKVGSAVVGSFNPLGSESTILQLAAPTIADPFVQWAENQNFAGIPIKPEQLPFDVPKPEYQMYWQNSRRPSRWITKKFNDLTGGDEVRPGLVSVSPEVIDLFVDTIAGGAGKFIDNTISLPGTLTKKDIDVRRIPFIRKVYGESPDYYLRTKFYDNLGEIRYAEKSKKYYSDDKEMTASMKRKYAWELRFVDRMRRDKTTIRSLRKKRRTFENQKELSKRDREKKIEETEKKVTEIMTDFNRTYKGGKGQKRVVSTSISKPAVSVTNKPLTLREAMRLK